MNESLDQSLVTHTTNTTIALTTPREQEPSEGRSMTNNGVSEREDQVETNGDDATTPHEMSSATTAQKIDFIIESAGSPRTGGTDGPAAALGTEPSQQSHLYELQQTSPPLVDRQEESSPRELQPAVHEGRVGTMPGLPLGLMVEDRSITADQCIVVGGVSTGTSAGEDQNSPVVQDRSPEQALHDHLDAMVSMQTKKSEYLQQLLREIDSGHHLSQSQHGDDTSETLQALSSRLWEEPRLDPMIPQLTMTTTSAHRAIDDYGRAQSVENCIGVAIGKWGDVQATTRAGIDRLKELVNRFEEFSHDLDISRQLLQEIQKQATASKRSSRRSINAFFGAGDDNSWNID
ncbi:hypothetical protein KCV03_g10346, partial [Aureobasidium melanogenum]